MVETLITSVISFISTNIDDIFVLMLFYSQVNSRLRNRDIIIGQYLGIGILVAISVIGAVGVNFLPEKYIGLLGLVPIFLGIKTWVDYKKEKAAEMLHDEKGSDTLSRDDSDAEYLDKAVLPNDHISVSEESNSDISDDNITKPTEVSGIDKPHMHNRLTVALERIIKPEILLVI